MRRLVAFCLVAVFGLSSCSTDTDGGEPPNPQADSTSASAVFDGKIPRSPANIGIAAGESETARVTTYLKWLSNTYVAAAEQYFAPLAPKIETSLILIQSSPASCSSSAPTPETTPDASNPTSCSRVSDGKIKIDLFLQTEKQTWLALGRSQQDGEFYLAAALGRALGRGVVDYLERTGVIHPVIETRRRLLAECVGGMLSRRSHGIGDGSKAFAEPRVDQPTSGERFLAFDTGRLDGRFADCLDHAFLN